MRKIFAYLLIVNALACPVALAQTTLSHSAARAVQEGLRIMSDRALGNCLACHVLTPVESSGRNEVTRTLGPSLDKVAARYSEERLRQWVTDARAINPNTLMPPFGSTTGLQRLSSTTSVLSETQISLVVAVLLTLR